MAGEIATAFVRIRAAVDKAQFQRSVESTTKATSAAGVKAGKGFSHGVVAETRKGVSPIKGIAAGIGGTFAAIGVAHFLKSSVEGAIQAQEVFDKVKFGLERLKIPAKDVEAAMTANSAAARNLGFSGSEANNSLLTLTRLSGNLPGGLKAMAAAEDVARAKGVGLEQATKAVQGAMFGNVRALRQLSIRLAPATDAQDKLKNSIQKLKDESKNASSADKDRITQQIRSLQATKGQAKEADKVLTGQRALALIQQKIGDQAERFTETSAGKLAVATAQLNKIKAQIGGAVLPAIAASASFIVTQLLKVQGFLGRIKAAKDLKAKISIAVSGLEDAKKKIETALFGQDFLGGGKGRQDVHVDGIVDNIKQAFAKIDWSAVGATISTGIAAGLKGAEAATKTLDDQVSQWLTVLQAHLPQFADFGAQLIANLVVKLTDPAFWLKHWQLAIAVAIAVFPVGKFAKLGELIIGPFAKLGAKLAPVLGRALADALLRMRILLADYGGRFGLWLFDGFVKGLKIVAKVGAILLTILKAVVTHVVAPVVSEAGKLALAILNKIYGVFNKLTLGLLGPVLRLGVLAAIVGVVSAAVSKAVALGTAIVNGVKSGLATIFSAVISALDGVKNAVTNVASNALNWGIDIGESLVSGVIHGITNMIGSALSAVGGFISSLVGHAKKIARAGSPSMLFAEEVGVPIMLGIAKGIEMATHRATIAIKNSVVTLLGAAQEAVASAKQNLTSLGSSLASSVGDIIDAQIKARTKPLADKLAAMQAADTKGDLAGQRADLVTQLAGPRGEGQSEAEYIKQQADIRKQIADMDRAATEQALQDKIDAIQKEGDARKDQAQKSIGDLIALFNAGKITGTELARGLSEVLKANGASFKEAGNLLGFAFAQSFQSQMTGIASQVTALAKVMGLPGSGAGGASGDVNQTVSPIAAVKGQLADAQKDKAKERARITKLDRIERDALAVLHDKHASATAKTHARERLADARKEEAADRRQIAKDDALIKALRAILAEAQKGGAVTVTGGNTAADASINATAGASAR